MSLQPLSELVEQRNEKVAAYKDPDLPYIGLEHLAQNSPTLLGTIPASSSTSTNSVFKPDDILFGKLRPNLKKSLQVGFAGYCSTDILVLRARSGVEPSFAARLLQHETVFDEAVRTAVGTKMPRTSWYDLGAFKVFTPPLHEQRRIAEILDAADAAIEQTETLISKLKQMKTGLTHDLLTRGLDEHGELRDPDANPEQFKDSPLGWIPREWGVCSLDDLCSLLNGLAFKPEDWARSGTPIIRIQNLNGSPDFNYFEGRVSEPYLIPPGTLLFSWSGNRGTSFGPYVWQGLTGLLNQHIFKVTPKANIHARWLFYALDVVQQLAERSAHGGSGLVHVRRSDLLKYLVATPEKEEQHCIAEVLDAHDARIRAEEAYRDKLGLQKAGLMDDLLTGRVRVNAAKEVGA